MRQRIRPWVTFIYEATGEFFESVVQKVTELWLLRSGTVVVESF